MKMQRPSSVLLSWTNTDIPLNPLSSQETRPGPQYNACGYRWTGLAGWVVNNRQAALVDNTSLDSRWYLHTYEKDQDGVDAKSAVAAPLLVREQLIGVITLVHPKPNFFTSDHLALVQAIADQAGIAAPNARYYSESQRQVHVMTALVEVATAVTASLDLEDVFLRILDQIIQTLSVQAVCLALLDPSEEHLVVRAAKGWKEIREQKPLSILVRYPAGWQKKANSIIIQDAPGDPRFR
jgi:GAF domain-containing protein